VWSPDGETIFYAAESPQFTIHRRPVDGSRGTELFFARQNDTSPTSITPDGQFVLFANDNDNMGTDIWMVSVADPSQPQLVLQGPFDETSPRVSPNGRWLAFVSDESGRSELYVTSFPEVGARTRVSIDGCTLSEWSISGDELIFQGPAGHKVVSIDQPSSAGGSLEIGRPKPLFNGLGQERLLAESRLVTSNDREKFLVAHTPDEARPHTLHVTLNWIELLPTD